MEYKNTGVRVPRSSGGERMTRMTWSEIMKPILRRRTVRFHDVRNRAREHQSKIVP